MPRRIRIRSSAEILTPEDLVPIQNQINRLERRFVELWKRSYPKGAGHPESGAEPVPSLTPTPNPEDGARNYFTRDVQRYFKLKKLCAANQTIIIEQIGTGCTIYCQNPDRAPEIMVSTDSSEAAAALDMAIDWIKV